MAHRVIAPDSVAVKPASPVGPQGYFEDDLVGTVVPAGWLNMVQDEIINALALRGITPDPSDDTQLYQLLGGSVRAVESNSIGFANVTSPNTRAAIAVASCTVGVPSGPQPARTLVAASTSCLVGGSDAAIVASQYLRTNGPSSFIAASRGPAGPAANPIVALGVCASMISSRPGDSSNISGDCAVALGSGPIDLRGSYAGSVCASSANVYAALSLAAASQQVVIGGYEGDGSTACAVLASRGIGPSARIYVGNGWTPAVACAVVAVDDTGAGNDTAVAGNAIFVAASRAAVVESGPSSRVAVIASDGVDVDASSTSAVIGVAGGEMAGQSSVIMGGNSQLLAGNWSGIVAGTGNQVSADRSSIIGGESNTVSRANSHIIGGSACDIGSGGRRDVVVLGSRLVSAQFSAAGTDYQIMGGVNSFAGAPKWRIDSADGRFRGTNAATTGGLDYAEYFANADGVAHPPGRILSRSGRSVTLGQPGLRPVGVVSSTPSIIGGDDGLAWAGRYARDEWGRPLWDDVEVDGGEEARTIRVMRESPDYDVELAATHTPRSERPDEWTLVGLLGQVLIAVEEDVQVDDFVQCGTDGIGARSSAETRIEVMDIVTPFDAAKGYAQALVLVR